MLYPDWQPLGNITCSNRPFYPDQTLYWICPQCCIHSLEWERVDPLLALIHILTIIMEVQWSNRVTLMVLGFQKVNLT